MNIILLWFVLFIFSFGVLGFAFVYTKRATKRPWRINVKNGYKPKVSILVPTFNESKIIYLKLENLARLDYPKDLTQIIVVDSNSKDQTPDIVKDFIGKHPETNLQVLMDYEMKGKSAALNMALEKCQGEVVVISDSDSLWRPDILSKALPYLSDTEVGAISGPKVLLNPEQSWVTKTEDAYLDTLNMRRLGESKIDSTLFFEGGFSAYKKDLVMAFDPYNTGSDDNGTVMQILEKKKRAVFVPEAEFFTVFSTTWKGKLAIKARRANQLVRVLSRYVSLLLGKRIQTCKTIILLNVITLLLSPLIFIFFLGASILLLLQFPYFLLLLSVFLIPRARFFLLEIISSFLLVFVTLFFVVLGKKFMVWKKPEEKVSVTEEMLRARGLI